MKRAIVLSLVLTSVAGCDPLTEMATNVSQAFIAQYPDLQKPISLVFVPGREILIDRSAPDSLAVLRRISPDDLAAIGQRARARVLAGHTAAHRAAELEAHVAACRRNPAVPGHRRVRRPSADAPHP